jgi:hypothetical protein
MINDIFTTRSGPLERPDQHPQLHNSRLATTGQATAVRYAIDDELWQSFTVEQVTKQIGLLRETGRFREPNNGDPFVVRLSYYALVGDLAVSDNADQLLAISPIIVTVSSGSIVDRDILTKQGRVPNTQNSQRFYDFSFDGDTLTITLLTRLRRPGSLTWTTQQRQDGERLLAESLRDKAVDRIWWERDYVCVRCQIPQAEWEECREIGWMAAHAVSILLQDRRVNKIEIEPKERSKLRLNFLKRRPQIPNSENLPEVVLTIPRCVYPKTSGKTGKPHGPHRMHYRSEHIRRQQIGPRSAPSYKEVVIPGTWVNASDVSPEERGTPITRNYRFKAQQRKEKLHSYD